MVRREPVGHELMTDRHDETDQPTLLIVDDDDTFRSTLGDALGRRGFLVSTAPDSASAVAVAGTTPFEYALVDIRMPGESGLDLVTKLRALDEGTRIVVMTGYGTIASAVVAMKNGAIDYITKPVDADICERALLGLRDDREEPEIPSLERVEWEYMQRVLADCDGNVSVAARRLRVHRRSLQRKLAKHPIDLER
jgi:two-component system response regulator RegA